MFAIPLLFAPHARLGLALSLCMGLGLTPVAQAKPRPAPPAARHAKAEPAPQVSKAAQAAASKSLPPEVLQALRRARVPREAVSVLVTPLPAPGSPDPAPAEPLPPPHKGKKGKKAAATPAPAEPVRLSHRPQEAMNPASVMKLVTTYAALDMLGAQYTWSNRVYIDGSVQDGVLHGNLILRGSGDPKLVVERLDALLRQIQAAGVRSVQGDIVLDHSVFDLPDNPTAFDDEPLRPYNVAPDGLLLNFKSLILSFAPNEARTRATVRSEPPLANVLVPPDVPLDNGPCTQWREGLLADLSDPNVVRLGGTYPAACGEQKWPIAYPEPASYTARMVQAVWLASGGQLSGQVRDGQTPPQAQKLLAAPSLPLAELMADVNKHSNNVMAQQIFLSLSAGAQGRGSFAASRQRVASWWRERWPKLPAPVLDNGSGLSRSERISARALTALLRHAATGPQAEPFTASLAVAGVDGTVAKLRERLPQSPVLGRAQLKTGTLRNVVALAGYVQGVSGQRYTLVAFINHEHAAAARPALDQLLDWVAQDQALRP